MKNFILFVNFGTFRNYVRLRGENGGNINCLETLYCNDYLIFMFYLHVFSLVLFVL